MNQPVFEHPTSEALRQVTKAYQILDEVVTSSETFDYRKAKQGLKELRKMIRELGREEARLRAAARTAHEDRVVPFPVQASDSAAPV